MRLVVSVETPNTSDSLFMYYNKSSLVSNTPNCFFINFSGRRL